MEGRKLPKSLENPLDNLIIDAADALLPLVRYLNLTPNQVTLGSIAAEIVAVWALAAGKPLIFGFSAFTGVFLDYLDGHYARTDNMVTGMGDMMDHLSDIGYAVGVSAVVAWKTGWPGCVLPLSIIAIFAALQSIHLGCQQRYHEEVSVAPETLDAFKAVCPNAGMLPYTRWVGVGTFQVVLVIVAYIFVFGKKV